MDSLRGTSDAVTEMLSHVANSKSFGEVLQNKLYKYKIKQKHLADKIAWSRSEISRWVNNKLPKNFGLEQVNEIADILGCSEKDRNELVRGFLRTRFYASVFRKSELEEQDEDLAST